MKIRSFNGFTFMCLSACLLAAAGCKDYLNTEPLSFTTINNFYKNADDAEIALRGCYAGMRQSYSLNARAGIFFLGDIGTDEVIAGNPFTDPDTNMEQFMFARVVKTNRMITDYWSTLYSGIYAINQLLTEVDNIDMNIERREQIKAEASFLRGWHYMYLGQVFGGVPVYNSVPHDMEKGRNTLKEVMEQAIGDLSYAYTTLSDSVKNTPGFATKWAAGGYLAKLYCYLASSKKFGVGNSLNFPLNSYDWVNVDEYYLEANRILEDVIENSGAKLTEDYRTLFIEGSKDKQVQEILFTYLPSVQNQVGFALSYYMLPVGHYGGGWGTCRPTQEVYSRYDTLYDARSHWVVGGLGTDPITEVIDGSTYSKRGELALDNGVAGDGSYCGTKFRMLFQETRHTDLYSGLYPLLRLADLYLLQAEAVGHLYGDDAGREKLKVVRDRALIRTRTTDVDELQRAYRRSDFIDELLDERSRELCFEQQRRFDLIRFNRYVSAVKDISTTRGVFNRLTAQLLVDNVAEYKIWMPIPEEDEISNPNLLPNNPGY